MTWCYKELVQRVEAVLPPGLGVQTQLPPGNTAWLAVPVFSYAKQLDQPLPTAAHDVAKRIEALGDVTAEVIDGFVNISPNNELVTNTFTELIDPTFGQSEIGDGQTIIVELSSPNVAKPMSIGHLRSTIIGDALQRIYRTLGYRVTSINHLGDWGTQFGKLLVAYEEQFGDLEPRPVTIAELVALYVQFHANEAVDPSLTDRARAMFRRLEQGDAVARTLWRQFVDLSMSEFDRMYDRLGVVIDETVGESQYEPVIPQVLELAASQQLSEVSDGAVVIRVPGEETPLMLQKRDGTTTYATRDLAQVLKRVEGYQPTKILYVVANEQSLHFVQYHTVAKLLGIAAATDLVHVKFGIVRLKEGKMSTREGRVVLLEDVLDEAVTRARSIVDERNPDLPDLAKQRVTEAVGVGSVKFFDLFHDRRHDIVFDWDQMLNLKGDSAPYLMYSYTRAASILRKAGTVDGTDLNLSALSSQLSALVRTLARFPLVLEAVAADNAPHHLAQYLNHVATEFHRFYEQYPVLTAEGNERAIRLALVAGTANVLKRGLDLLGIPVLEQM